MKNPTQFIRHLPKPRGSSWNVNLMKNTLYEVQLITPFKTYTRVCSTGRYDKIPWLREMMLIDVARRLLADDDPSNYSYNQDEIHQFWIDHRKERVPSD